MPEGLDLPTQQGELWFLTGSQPLYGEETLRQVAEQSQQIAAGLDGSGRLPLPIVWKPVLTTAEAIRQACVDATADKRCVGVITWMHTFSPAKAWIGGLDALRKPLLHFHTQANLSLPWAEIDMDFMNLNQAAHGDREFGFIETRMRLRRKTVVGHWSDPSAVSRIADWARAAIGWQAAHEHAARQIRRQHARRRRHRRRQGRGATAARACRSTPTVSTIWSPSSTPFQSLTSMPSWPSTRARTTWCPRYGPAANAPTRCGTRRASKRHFATFLEDGGFTAFTTNFEDLGGLRQLPGLAVQRLMADGYGFGGEGDWKTASLVRLLKVMSAGLDGGTSFMEDYTYHLGPGEPKILGAHMLEVCPTISGAHPEL